MPNRKYTQKQREKRSELIQETKIWQGATGPLTMLGKRRSSRNSLKHGYYREVFCEFRKKQRKPETIRIEGLCLCLIKADMMDNLDDLSQMVSNVSRSVMEIWKSTGGEPINANSLLELKYIFALSESVVRYSTAIVTKKLRKQLKEQNEQQ
jgi:hypothetical protein